MQSRPIGPDRRGDRDADADALDEASSMFNTYAGADAHAPKPLIAAAKLWAWLAAGAITSIGALFPSGFACPLAAGLRR